MIVTQILKSESLWYKLLTVTRSHKEFWCETVDGVRYHAMCLFHRRTASVPEITRLFPQATIRRVPRAGHWLHHDQPEEFLRIVEEFLNS